jgi:hypothetical protein
MTTLCGKWVKTFSAASHALPEGMHMNSDYPFMLPAIKSLEGRKLTIVGRGGQEATVDVITRDGREYAYVEQSSTFERIYRRKPTRFRLLPFKDGETPAIGEKGSLL